MLKLPPQGRWRSVHQTLHFLDGQELPHGTQEFGALHTRQNDWKMDRLIEHPAKYWAHQDRVYPRDCSEKNRWIDLLRSSVPKNPWMNSSPFFWRLEGPDGMMCRTRW